MVAIWFKQAEHKRKWRNSAIKRDNLSPLLRTEFSLQSISYPLRSKSILFLTHNRLSSYVARMSSKGLKKVMPVICFLLGLFLIYVFGTILNLIAGENGADLERDCACDHIFFSPHDNFNLFFSCLLLVPVVSWVIVTINKLKQNTFWPICLSYALALLAFSYDELKFQILP